MSRSHRRIDRPELTRKGRSYRGPVSHVGRRPGILHNLAPESPARAYTRGRNCVVGKAPLGARRFFAAEKLRLEIEAGAPQAEGPLEDPIRLYAPGCIAGEASLTLGSNRCS